MRFWKRKRKAASSDWLDDVLFTWPDGTPFTVRDCLRSIEVKGVTGSGKSSGSGKFITEQILRHPKSTFFIVAQKPEEADIFREMFDRAGKKLVVMEEGSDKLCNFVDDEMKAGADVRAVTEFFTTLGEALEGGQGGGRDNDRYWRMLEQRIIYNAIGSVRLGVGKIDAPTIQNFISTAAYVETQLADEKWQAKRHNQIMLAAAAAKKDTIDTFDHANFVDFWRNEFVHLDDKPRSSGLSGVLNTLQTFNSGLVRYTCSTDTTVSPRVLDDGVSILVNYPFATYGPTGRFIAGGMRYKVQKHILRRKAKPGDFFNVMLLDEFQESVTEFDAKYLAQCRSHYGSMFTLTQSVHSEFSSMGGGHASHHKVGALTSQYGHHIAHTVDPSTAKGFVEMLGVRRETFVSLSPGEPASNYDMLMGQSAYRPSISESYQPVLQPNVFMHGLRQGGPGNGYLVDGIVIKTGESFRNGENWQKVAFSQI